MAACGKGRKVFGRVGGVWVYNVTKVT
jgi:hypothetical protein